MKQTFKEWLEKQEFYVPNKEFSIHYILNKYNELEPQPKFKVGDRVLTKRGEPATIREITKPYHYFLSCLNNIVITGYWQDDELELAPKTKKVFSLEKFVIYSKKLGSTDANIQHFLENWGFDLVGKTEEEARKLGLVISDNWMVETPEGEL